MVLNILFLPIFFFIGFVTSYEDFKYSKIRNKWIIFGAVYGTGIYSVLFLYNSLFYYFPTFLISQFQIPFAFFGKVLLNSLIALFLSFLLWRARAWSAGDAKLFFVFSLLIPLTHYWKTYLYMFPSFVLLLNIFIPLLLFLFFKSCIFAVKHLSNIRKLKLRNFYKNFKISKKNLGLKQKGLVVLIFLGVFLVLSLLQQKIGEKFSINFESLRMLAIPALIIFSRQIINFVQKPFVTKALIFTFLFILVYGFSISFSFTLGILLSSLKMMVIFITIFTLFNKFLSFYIDGSEKKKEERTFPLAIWIFLGGAITLIFKASILSLFLNKIL